jgi:hypothetical protein
MTVDELLAAAASAAPPPDLAPPLRALWLDASGDWAAAHGAVDDEAGADAAWVHAYLHRKEGDAANAAYWYRRAGRTPDAGGLDTEWRRIAAALLDGRSDPNDTDQGRPR